MKKIIVCCALLVQGFSFGQSINVPDKLVVNEGTKELDKVDRNVFTIAIAGEEKEIIKGFEDFLEDDQKYDVKFVFKKVSAENILVPSFSEKHFNLHAEVRESGSELELCYWVSFGSDVFVNSTDFPDEAENCKTLLKEYAKKYYTEFLNEDLSKSEELLEDSKDDLKDVTGGIVDLSKDQMKAKKDKEKLQGKRLKLEEDLAQIQLELKENELEVVTKEAEISKIGTSIGVKKTDETNIKGRISEQEKTLKELKAKLELIKTF
jgi:hypothetical protein